MELEKREELQGDPPPPPPDKANQSLHQSRSQEGWQAQGDENTNCERRQKSTDRGKGIKRQEGQRRTTHQFVFVEKLDEWGEDESVESL